MSMNATSSHPSTSVSDSSPDNMNSPYHSLFRNNHAVMLIIDPKNGRIIDANQAAIRFYGYTREELLDKRISDINILSEKEVFMEMQQAKAEKRCHFFFRHCLADGGIRDVEVYSGPITLDNRPLLYSIIHDITEQKQMQSALAFNQKQLKAVHDHINAAIYITDQTSHKILFMNAFLKKRIGKDLTGKTCWKHLHKNQTGPCGFCRKDRLFNTDGTPAPSHSWEYHDPETGCWYDIYNIAIPWIDGRLVRMQISTDITLRKQNEQEQKSINEQLEIKVKERTRELEDMNTALKILLKTREADKKEMAEKIKITYESIITPFLDKVKESLDTTRQTTLMGILESNLEELLKPFSNHRDPLMILTPVENQVAAMVKQGLTNKEMAEMLNKSVRTISNHRDHIRLKLGLRNKKVNLRSYLSSLH